MKGRTRLGPYADKENQNMFGLSKKEVDIFAPVTGQLVDLEQVPDEVFSEKMMGDGLAVRPDGGLFVAPADGELTMLFRTGHAYGMKIGRDVEILVHIGIDTVELNGEGFQLLAEQGQRVKAGDPIVQVDLDLVRGKGYDLITPVILTAPAPESGVKLRPGRMDAKVRAGVDVIFTVTP